MIIALFKNASRCCDGFIGFTGEQHIWRNGKKALIYLDEVFETLHRLITFNNLFVELSILTYGSIETDY